MALLMLVIMVSLLDLVWLLYKSCSSTPYLLETHESSRYWALSCWS